MSRRQSFCLPISTLFLVLLLPVAASAQFSDLDAAMSKLERGFGMGDPVAIVSGIASDDKVQLQFPGLLDQSGLFDREKAAYLLALLFDKVHPTACERVSSKRGRTEGDYNVILEWTISPGARRLYVTLRQKDGQYSLVSIHSAG